MPRSPDRGRSLSSLVSVGGAFARSTHVEWDFYGSARREYYLSVSSREALKGLLLALDVPSERAVTLIGPYGAGKSAFCVFLAQLLSGTNPEGIASVSKATHISPAAQLEKPLLPILIVGSRRPLGQILTTGLARGLKSAGRGRWLRSLEKRTNGAISESEPSAEQVVDLYKLAMSGAARRGAGGLLLIVDELGKPLEYAAQHPKASDMFVLQQLAELAVRSGETPLLFVGVLHQGAEDYARHLGRTQQTEWLKVSERFKQLPFFPRDAEQIDLVGHALTQGRPIGLPKGIRKICQEMEDLRMVPASLTGRFESAAKASYPLHPITLVLLPALFRRAAQSHRSLFNFLSGHEPHALSRFLAETHFDPKCPPLFMVDALFDYAAEVMLGAGGSIAFSRDWAEAIEAAEQAAGHLPEAELSALKVIALLGVAREPRLPASPQAVKLALTRADGSIPDVNAILEKLHRERHLSYSRHVSRYRLWEGGDVDVEGELETAQMGVPASTATQAALRLGPPSRLIARRHSYRTGTLRSVQISASAAAEIDAALDGAEGELTVLLCLAGSDEDAETAAARARGLSTPDVAVGIAHETHLLQDTARTIVAAARVRSENRALDGDRAARRHLEARRNEAEEAFLAEWQRIFGPAGTAEWFYRGKPFDVSSQRQFSALLSQMADESYRAAPMLRNELINREVLSSAAAAGRRNLIECMLKGAELPTLGIEGFPPERSMYECILRQSGLHRELSPGVWGFSEPSADDPARLLPAWEALTAAVFSDPPGPRPVTDLYAMLKAFPYGLTDGVLPVLLCAFMLVHDRETTLYREGTFVPEPGIADFEVLMRRPEQFAIAGCKVTGDRAAVVKRIAAKLGQPAGVVPVVRSLIGMARSLPEFAHKTRELSASLLVMREAIKTARSPESLLFGELPEALGLKPFSGRRTDRRRINRFFDRLNEGFQEWAEAYPGMVGTARDQLLEACGMEPGEEGWAALRQRAAGLDGVVLDLALAPFMHRSAMEGDEQTVLESVLALVANRPPRSWGDADAARFPTQARALGALVQEALGSAAPASTADLTAPRLTPEEEGESRKLAKKISKLLGGRRSKPVPDHVIRAALLSLLSECGVPPQDEDAQRE